MVELVVQALLLGIEIGRDLGLLRTAEQGKLRIRDGIDRIVDLQELPNLVA